MDINATIFPQILTFQRAFRSRGRVVGTPGLFDFVDLRQEHDPTVVKGVASLTAEKDYENISVKRIVQQGRKMFRYQ